MPLTFVRSSGLAEDEPGPLVFTATVPAGINETIAANVKIFPSVTHDAVSVILPANNEKLSLSLFNVEGRLIHQSIAPAAGTASLDMGALNNGMYLLVIRNDNTIIQTKKIVKE